MFSRILCCALCACVVSPVFGQECIPGGGFDLHVRFDLLVDRAFDWSACDTYIDDGVKVTIVGGGSIVGSPRFEGDSHLFMEDGYIQELNTFSGDPWGVISGGSSDNLHLVNREHGSSISGGEHKLVGGDSLVISGGNVHQLVSYGRVDLTGGAVDSIYKGYLFWSGGVLGRVLNSGENSVVVVEGSNLSFQNRVLTGTLLDGSAVNQSFPFGEFVLAEHGLIDGDVNRDGLVGIEDLNAIRNHFGESGYTRWDIDYNQQVDLGDLNAVRNHFGESSVNPVPEPSSLAIMVLGLLALAGIPSLRHYWRCYQTLQSP